MRVVDPGHVYDLENLDDDGPPTVTRLRFVKRIGDKFPGNAAPGHPGTITQEVLRALIERTKYVNGQREHVANFRVLRDLRSALVELELRAAEERGDVAAKHRILGLPEPELAWTCSGCGHILCRRDHT